MAHRITEAWWNRTPSTPWFQRQRTAALAVALVLSGAVFWLRLQRGDDADEAITLLYVLPITLLAVMFGRRGGIASGLVSVALVVVWVQSQGINLSLMAGPRGSFRCCFWEPYWARR